MMLSHQAFGMSFSMLTNDRNTYCTLLPPFLVGMAHLESRDCAFRGQAGAVLASNFGAFVC